jgi:aerobic carbon-monoxide dehydrogenase small subunit
VPDGRSVRLSCTINGRRLSLEGHPMARLLDVLRQQAGLTGTKEGCGEGECGACAVLLNGQLANSCLTPLAHADNAAIVTIEGVASGDDLHVIQEAFLEYGGAQCGICTPGMLMAARAYLDAGGGADESGIREAIAGNLCRCTGYTKIVDAIALAAGGRR